MTHESLLRIDDERARLARAAARVHSLERGIEAADRAVLELMCEADRGSLRGLEHLLSQLVVEADELRQDLLQIRTTLDGACKRPEASARKT